MLYILWQFFVAICDLLCLVSVQAWQLDLQGFDDGSLCQECRDAIC